MLLDFFKQPAILMLACALCVFVEMFLVKKWFTTWTVKIENAKARRGVNVLLGIITCFALAAAQMFAFCDILGATYSWVLVAAATGIATVVYLILEKIFGESEVNELGKALANFISHSGEFDGQITKKGVTAVAKELINMAKKVDDAEATKEAKAIDEVVKRLDGFLSDGKVTAEEKVAATELINKNNIDVNSSTYERFRALLNK